MAFWDLFTGTTGSTGSQTRKTVEDAAEPEGPPVLPDFTDQIIKAIQRAEAQRLRGVAGRTRQAAFGEMPDFSGLFPIGGNS